ncbi:flavodoxin family protein [Nonomuraea recticatena]|uniref:Flavodoxin family protein n=2 Tax=Nonomuraea recticatena TaxID=46178 RepID=A0ABN3S087_9ACTN
MRDYQEDGMFDETQVRVAVAFHSAYGHTARQAEAVADGARAVEGTTVELLAVDELDDALWSSLDAADAIVFGAPTYMGSPSAGFKIFAEGTSAVLKDNLRWKDKVAAGFTNSGCMSGDKLNTLVDLAMLAAQHGMIWVGLALPGGWSSSGGSVEDLNRLGSWLGAMAQSDSDVGPDIAPPATDLRTASELGRRVAIVTRAYRRGADLEQLAAHQAVSA